MKQTLNSLQAELCPEFDPTIWFMILEEGDEDGVSCSVEPVLTLCGGHPDDEQSYLKDDAWKDSYEALKKNGYRLAEEYEDTFGKYQWTCKGIDETDYTLDEFYIDVQELADHGCLNRPELAAAVCLELARIKQQKLSPARRA